MGKDSGNTSQSALKADVERIIQELRYIARKLEGGVLNQEKAIRDLNRLTEGLKMFLLTFTDDDV